VAKKNQPKFQIWVRRDHYFTADIVANSIAEALEIANKMSIDELVDAPGEQVDDDHKITGIMEL